jgi:hypothetical protein
LYTSTEVNGLKRQPVPAPILLSQPFSHMVSEASTTGRSRTRGNGSRVGQPVRLADDASRQRPI